eukprot:CAMPEP_0170513432 /NCGR_PEP_ID=MMETSP0208-20121228/67397_1 /TAXON_ID=197538 /ORGANISM="Strombidium inclinatum, Strain S3" /LENGTH=91 /DNA_ID=CAMNT_0010797163 /DNA_START=402 /DNA_END=677 /DNA_ORIENTATION=+
MNSEHVEFEQQFIKQAVSGRVEAHVVEPPPPVVHHEGDPEHEQDRGLDEDVHLLGHALAEVEEVVEKSYKEIIESEDGVDTDQEEHTKEEY